MSIVFEAQVSFYQVGAKRDTGSDDNGGGRSLEDMKVIRGDVGFREILSLGRIPSSDAAGDSGCGGWERAKGWKDLRRSSVGF
jgi:hypothetical protein